MTHTDKESEILARIAAALERLAPAPATAAGQKWYSTFSEAVGWVLRGAPRVWKTA